MKRLQTLLCLLFFSQVNAFECHNSVIGAPEKKIILASKQISIEGFPAAYNPSIIPYKEGYLMTFRESPDRYNEYWLSYLGVILLDKDFQPISKPQILNTQQLHPEICSQAEDARLFTHLGKIFMIYNDCREEIWYSGYQRRDMYLAELVESEGVFSITTPLKLTHAQKYHQTMVQKNWMPFIYQNSLLLSYSLFPHEVLFPNLSSGTSFPVFETNSCTTWNLGEVRPGSPPLLVDGDFLGFFHSPKYTKSPVSGGETIWHYFMGAYTFSAHPPFEIKKITPFPLTAKGFFTHSELWKRVIYPGGAILKGDLIYLVYGKDDREVWVATIDKNHLLEAMVPVIPMDNRIYEEN